MDIGWTWVHLFREIKIRDTILYLVFSNPNRGYALNWSERHDLNVRPLPPQGSALAKLSYAPNNVYNIILWSSCQH